MIRPVILFVIVLLSFTSSAQKNAYVVFKKAKKMPKPVFGAAYCSDGTKAIIAGGRGYAGVNSSDILMYDAALGDWLDLSPSSDMDPVFFGTAVYLDDYKSALFLGGTKQDKKYIYLEDNLTYYDLSTLQTRSLGQNPIAAKLQGAAYWKGKVYIFGGSKNSDGKTILYNPELYAYSLQTGVMDQLAALPVAKEVRGEIIDGMLYIVGGYYQKASNRVHRYDLAEDKWDKVAELDKPISAYAMVKYQHYLILVGDYKELDRMVVFDTKTLTAKTFKMNFKGRHAAAAVLNNELHVFGGFNPEKDDRVASDQHWKLDLDQFFKFNY
ncbi:Kelch repeat-containing protein [Reichenbachiella ulvae]|uniref:N-acetylneuraminic acid mutarotase n=1 Tax=Reichenbachiella ulvae TaxID=2980104 RepID=A0ABT3CX77_9BACT|nr:kelch-like protein [Reichenbachiella ulvae]MCV9388232.1 hypothetical protein [Reichenbachiella ulvae]